MVAARERWMNNETDDVDEENLDWRALKRSTMMTVVEFDPDGRARA